MSVPCTDSSDAVCAPITNCAVGIETEEIPPSFYADRVCKTCRECPLGSYATGQCTPEQDTPCAPWTNCVAGQTFELYAGSPFRDRVCANCTGCSNFEYESVSCSPLANTVCHRLTTCDNDEYQDIEPTPTTDRSCLACSVCTPGNYAVAECTPLQNRNCEPTTNCSTVVIPSTCDVAVAVQSSGQFAPVPSYSGAYGIPSPNPSRNIVSATLLVSGSFTLSVNLVQVRMAGTTFRLSLRDSLCASGASTITDPDSSVLVLLEEDLVCDLAGTCSVMLQGLRNVSAVAHAIPFSLEISDASSGDQLFCMDTDTSGYVPGGGIGMCVNECPRGSYRDEEFNCCISCSDCENGNFASGGCVGTTDTICTPWSTCNTGVTYERASGTASSDIECASCSYCEGDSYAIGPCSQITDTVCSARTSCLNGVSFESTFGSATTDRECSACNDCSLHASVESFSAIQCTIERDAVCSQASSCTSTQYERTTYTATSDRICENCTICQSNAVTVNQCTRTSDTLCAIDVESTGEADSGSSSPVIIVVVVVVVVLLVLVALYFIVIRPRQEHDEDLAKSETLETGMGDVTGRGDGEMVGNPMFGADSPSRDSTIFGFGAALDPEEQRRLEKEQREEEERRQAEDARIQKLLRRKLSDTNIVDIKNAQDRRASQFEETRAASVAVIEQGLSDEVITKTIQDSSQDQNVQQKELAPLQRRGSGRWSFRSSVKKDNSGIDSAQPEQAQFQRSYTANKEQLEAAGREAIRIAKSKEEMVLHTEHEESSINAILDVRKEVLFRNQEKRAEMKKRETERINAEKAEAEQKAKDEAETKALAEAQAIEEARIAKQLAYEESVAAKKDAELAESERKRAARKQREAEARVKAEQKIAERRAKEQAKRISILSEPQDTGLPDWEKEAEAGILRRAEREKAAIEANTSVTLQDINASQLSATATENADAASVNKNRESVTDDSFGFPPGFGFPSDLVDDSDTAENTGNTEQTTFGFPAGFGFPSNIGADDSD